MQRVRPALQRRRKAAGKTGLQEKLPKVRRAQITDFPKAMIPGITQAAKLRTKKAVLAAVAAAVILLIGIIVFIAVGGKKKKGKTAGKADETKTGVSTGGNYGDTEILGGNVPKGTDGSACIRIRDASHPEQVWSLSLSDTIAVGRVTDCQICVADESVSRKQCLIYLVDNIPTIENKSNSNITRLNGDQLNVPRPLKAGDKIKCGRVTLIVDSFYRGTGGEKGPLNKDTRFVNV